MGLSVAPTPFDMMRARRRPMQPPPVPGRAGQAQFRAGPASARPTGGGLVQADGDAKGKAGGLCGSMGNLDAMAALRRAGLALRYLYRWALLIDGAARALSLPSQV